MSSVIEKLPAELLDYISHFDRSGDSYLLLRSLSKTTRNSLPICWYAAQRTAGYIFGLIQEEKQEEARSYLARYLKDGPDQQRVFWKSFTKEELEQVAGLFATPFRGVCALSFERRHRNDSE